MAEKKKKKTEVKDSRLREVSIISIIIVYIIGIALVGIGAYAFAEREYVEDNLSKMARRYSKLVTNKEDKTITFINTELEDKVCKNEDGNVSCVKNISDSSLAKGYTLLLSETYKLDGKKKTNILSILTVNGSVITAEAGYEFDTIEPKKFGNNTYLVCNLVNTSGSTYTMVIDNTGKVALK